ncbi:MAG: Crp/Fnr family transcriptional regulator [Saprospiraceae bacterium]
MEAFNKFLQQFPNYTPKVFENVRPYLSIKHLKTEAYFLQHGKICRDIAFIEKGFLRLFYLNDGKEITNCFCRENTITTAYSSLISSTESDLAIQATEPTKLIVFSYDSLKKMYEQDMFWQQLGRLASESEYITTECHSRFLRDLTATERYKQILVTDYELLQRVSLKHLSTYLQVSPETLSRIRKKISRT